MSYAFWNEFDDDWSECTDKTVVDTESTWVSWEDVWLLANGTWVLPDDVDIDDCTWVTWKDKWVLENRLWVDGCEGLREWIHEHCDFRWFNEDEMWYQIERDWITPYVSALTWDDNCEWWNWTKEYWSPESVVPTIIGGGGRVEEVVKDWKDLDKKTKEKIISILIEYNKVRFKQSKKINLDSKYSVKINDIKINNIKTNNTVTVNLSNMNIK